ncbi:MAG: hypothetical protein LUC43_02715 [Burkholderiales bacterium]|nr:hypothetical protein [Burkholderiales bacterium]
MTREEILAVESLSKQEITGLVAYIEWAGTTTKALKKILDAVFLNSSQEKITKLAEEFGELLMTQSSQTNEIVPLAFGRIEKQLAAALEDPNASLSPDEKVVDEWFRVASTCRMTEYVLKVAQHLLKKKSHLNAVVLDKTSQELEIMIEMFSRDYSQIRNLYTALVKHDLKGAGSSDPANEAEMEATMLFDSDLSNVLPFHYLPLTPTKH